MARARTGEVGTQIETNQGGRASPDPVHCEHHDTTRHASICVPTSPGHLIVFKLRPRFLLASMALLLVLIFIALFVRDQFVRPFLGDVLAVIWLHLTARSFIDRSPRLLATLVLLVAIALELGQYADLIHLLGLEGSRAARILLGATFDPLDLFAYFTGWVLILLGEHLHADR